MGKENKASVCMCVLLQCVTAVSTPREITAGTPHQTHSSTYPSLHFPLNHLHIPPPLASSFPPPSLSIHLIVITQTPPLVFLPPTRRFSTHPLCFFYFHVFVFPLFQDCYVIDASSLFVSDRQQRIFVDLPISFNIKCLYSFH